MDKLEEIKRELNHFPRAWFFHDYAEWLIKTIEQQQELLDKKVYENEKGEVTIKDALMLVVDLELAQKQIQEKDKEIERLKEALEEIIEVDVSGTDKDYYDVAWLIAKNTLR